MAEPVGIMWTTIEEGFTMEEERRVCISDQSVPGPEGAPIWCIEIQRTYATYRFVRANTNEEALQLFYQYSDKHIDEIDTELSDSDPIEETIVTFHKR